jgi:hypothetical protein
MPDFTKRATQPELLDMPDIPFEEIQRNMHELDVINTWLGGHKITVRGIRSLLTRKSQAPQRIAGADGTPLHICEIGCGGGDNLRAIEQWARRRGIAIRVTGIDINPHCIRYAQQRWDPRTKAEWIVSDYRTVSFEDRPDITFSSLFCHHFDDASVPGILAWSADNSRLGFFINDLHRHPLAYYSIKWLTAAFSRSRLVRNDAPLSVAKGFSRGEWKTFIDKSLSGKAFSVDIRWAWAFRWLLIGRHLYRPHETMPVRHSGIPLQGQ